MSHSYPGPGASPIDVTYYYYEHIDGVVVNHSSYDPSLDIKSLQ